MPTTLTRVANFYKIGSTDITQPAAGLASGGAPITKGDLITLASGAVQEAVAAGSTVANGTRIGVCNDLIASGTATATLVGIEKPDDTFFIELPIAISTGGSNTVSSPGAISTPSTTLPTYVGNQYGISRATTTGNPYYVDTAITGASSVKVEVVELGPTYPSSANFSTVICKVLAGSRLN